MAFYYHTTKYQISLSFLLDIKLHFTSIKWKDRLLIILLGEALGVGLPSGQYGVDGGLALCHKIMLSMQT